MDKLLNLSSQLLNKLDSIATSLAIIAQDMAGQGQEAEPDDSPAQSVYLDD